MDKLVCNVNGLYFQWHFLYVSNIYALKLLQFKRYTQIFYFDAQDLMHKWQLYPFKTPSSF